MNFEKRIEKLRKMFDVLEVDSMVFYQGNNNRYLTGFSGGAGEGMLAISREKAQFVTDSRYQEEYKNNMPNGVDFVVSRDYYGLSAEALNNWGVEKVGFEDNLPFNIFDLLDEKILADFVPTPSVIESLREIKDDDELMNIRQATKRSVDAFNKLWDFIAVGVTEKEIADQLDYLAKKEGLEKTSFDTIVASGENSVKPHATASNRKLQDGDIVTIDFGYYYNGYTSDITRTFGIGNISDEIKKIYSVVKEAEFAAIDAIKKDIPLESIDKIARDIIEQAGYGKYFNHSTGHGVGLDIHEGPRVSSSSDDESTVGDILTIEPGIYVPNIGGVRIEDDVIVTENGNEVLTDGITRELKIIN
jgi:Xaa-Pro aminopeptidase